MEVPVASGIQTESETEIARYTEVNNRELFYYLINRDEFPAVILHAQELVDGYLQACQQLMDSAPGDDLPECLRPFPYSDDKLDQRIVQLQQLHRQQAAQARPETEVQQEQLIHLLKQYAPANLLDGCWLQNISLASNCQSETAASLFHLYSQKIGDGDTARHYGNLYRSLLNSAGIHLPEINSRLFTTQKDLPDSAFARPVFQLALSLFPRTRLPELIGYTLGHFVASHDHLLMALSDVLQARGFDMRYCRHYTTAGSAGHETDEKGWVAASVALVKHYLSEAEANERAEQWQRIWKGLLLHRVVNQTWLDDLQRSLTDYTQTPRQKMLALVRNKAVPARNMHRHRKMNKRLLNDWFAEEPFDAEGFLDSLATSPFVNQRIPEKSLLTTRSIDFGGPMFRIFTNAEQAVIKEWIASLASQPETTGQSVSAPSVPVQRTALPESVTTLQGESATYARCSNRELYYYFVNADLYPDVLPTAYKVAQKFFAKATKSLSRRKPEDLLAFFPYSYEALEARLLTIYESETNAYEPLTGDSTVPREIMVWYIQQYAAFTMVDGSWVQNIARAGMSHTEISARLFRIYSDEVGNADTFKNHPNVYRRMLEGEGIIMPPTDSMDFAMQPELLDFAFDLPLLTLSVAMFPTALLPEIIGVNLAIELSGLGKGYMEIIDELRYWKIDPYFFTLHLTIDNIASGHTAVAIETTHLYLDQVLTTQGQAAMQQEWRRIWTGYLAFTQTAKQFESNVERKAAVRFIKPLLRTKWKAWQKQAASAKN